MIAFFGLNKRDELLWGRAEKIRELEKSLAQINSGIEDESRSARADVERLVSGFSEHTACVRAMIRLYQADVTTARLFFEAVRQYLDSKTPKTYHERSGRFESAPPPSV